MKKFSMSVILFVMLFITNINVKAQPEPHVYTQCFYELEIGSQEVIIEFRSGSSAFVDDTDVSYQQVLYHDDDKSKAIYRIGKMPNETLTSNEKLLDLYMYKNIDWIYYPNKYLTEEDYLAYDELKVIISKEASTTVFSDMTNHGTCPTSTLKWLKGGEVISLYGEINDAISLENAYVLVNDNYHKFSEEGFTKKSVEVVSCQVATDADKIRDVKFYGDINACAKAPAVDNDALSSKTHVCKYDFGTSGKNNIEGLEEKDFCNFTLESTWTKTSKKTNDFSSITTSSYNFKVTENYSKTTNSSGIGAKESGMANWDIRPASHEFKSLTLNFNKSIVVEMHTSSDPGSCMAGDGLFAYRGSTGYVLTTSEREAKNNSKVGFYCTGDGQTHLIPQRADLYGCDVIPEDIRDWIIDTLNLVKYVALVLVIVLGALDFIKAAASGEADQMKKSGSSFLKRIIAVVILFLVPLIVEVILNLIEIYGADSTCIDITQ